MNEPSKTAGTILAWAVTASVLLSWGYYEFWHKTGQHARKRATAQADIDKRLAQWAYVAKEKQIAPGETLRLVVIPHSSGLDMMDVKCFIYTNKDFQKAQFSCPDARQLDIEEP